MILCLSSTSRVSQEHDDNTGLVRFVSVQQPVLRLGLELCTAACCVAGPFAPAMRLKSCSTCTRVRQLRPNRGHMQQFNNLLAHSCECEGRRSRAVCTARGPSQSEQTTQHSDEVLLQPHTEWGKLMANSVAQLQNYSDSPDTFKVSSSHSQHPGLFQPSLAVSWIVSSTENAMHACEHADQGSECDR